MVPRWFYKPESEWLKRLVWLVVRLSDRIEPANKTRYKKSVDD